MSTEEYFNSGRLKVIGLITAATVAVGALGGIAGVVFDPDPVSTEPSIQPASGTGSLGSVGQGSPRLAPKPLQLSTFHGRPGATAGFSADDASDDPTSVGSIEPGSGGASPAETGFPSEEPTTSEPDPGTGGSGTGATMSATGVDVFVPDGWDVGYQDDQNVAQTNGQGSYSYAFSATVDPSVSAGDIITQNLDVFLPTDSYTQRQVSDVQPLDPFGSIVSAAAIGYEALWVDNQGSVSLHGEMYVGIRQDGTLLVILIEQLPAEEFESHLDEFGEIVGNTFARFAGVA